MNESELYGRTIRVNLAKPMKNKEGGSKAIWNTDEYLQEHVSAENKENADDEQQATSDQTTDEVIVLELLNYWLCTRTFSKTVPKKLVSINVILFLCVGNCES